MPESHATHALAALFAYVPAAQAVHEAKPPADTHPDAQGLHVVTEEGDVAGSGYVPAAQGTHAVWPVLGLTDPAPQAEHAVAEDSALAYVPGPHTWHDAAAPVDADPWGHGSGADCAALGYDPGAHCVHTVAPAAAYVPGMVEHATHAWVLLAWYEPAGHTLHCEAPAAALTAAEPGTVEHATHAATEPCPVSGLANPGEHAVHTDAELAHCPAGHGVQAERPVPTATCPAGQGMHATELTPLTVPALHV